MKKILILNHEIFALYWNRNLQLRTPNMDVVRIFLMRAVEKGDNLNLYHVNSNMSAKYSVQDLLKDCPL